MSRKLIYLFITALLIVVIIEIFSLLFIKFYALDRYDNIFWYDYEVYVDNIPDSYIEKFRKYSYDKDLGWDVSPNSSRTATNNAGSSWIDTIDSLGSRWNPFRSDKTLISTYGDSYTFGHEVNDDETWQYYLSRLAGTKVLNFGVGAYGYEQAFLKLRRNFNKGISTPIVILSFWSGGINRLLTMYRPFYRKETSMKLAFKPIVVKTNEGYKWVKNPLQELNSRQDILEALYKSKEYDFWFESRTIKNKFPYSLRVIQLVRLVLRGEHKLRDYQWENPDVIGILEYLINSFYQHSQEYEYLPVVVIIPQSGELQYRLKGGSHNLYAEFFTVMKNKYDGKKIVFIDIYEREFDERHFFIQEFDGHASPYGNRIIAEGIYESIRMQLEELQK